MPYAHCISHFFMWRKSSVAPLWKNVCKFFDFCVMRTVCNARYLVEVSWMHGALICSSEKVFFCSWLPFWVHIHSAHYLINNEMGLLNCNFGLGHEKRYCLPMRFSHLIYSCSFRIANSIWFLWLLNLYLLVKETFFSTWLYLPENLW